MLNPEKNFILDLWRQYIRNCQQITFVTLNRFCPLSKKNPTHPVLNGYQNG